MAARARDLDRRDRSGSRGSSRRDSHGSDRLTVAGTGAELGLNFAGQTFHNQRRDADGGNQLSLEPPDQGLCVGNGELIETVNDIVATYSAATGAKTSPASGFESLNQFYIGDHQVNRPVNPSSSEHSSPIRGASTTHRRGGSS
jgi:hypothetical protein